MASYEISFLSTGAILGTYKADDCRDALDVMGRTGVDRVIGAYCGHLPLHVQKKKRQRAHKRLGL